MEYLLSARTMPVIESFCLVKCLFAFDYDGTLAAISPDPSSAYMRDSTAELLKELSEISKIAIITGRSVEDVEKLLPLKPDFVIGNHGCEGIHPEHELEQMEVMTRTWLRSFDGALPILQKLGITLEDKKYSLSFHYRHAFHTEIAEGALELLLAKVPACRITKGKFVMNLVPENAFDKGKALDAVMRGNSFPFGVYFGDDQTDEDVFKYNNSKLLTIKIGLEATNAKYYLKSQTEIDSVLRIILGFLKK